MALSLAGPVIGHSQSRHDPMPVEAMSFSSHATRLAGSLVLPEDGTPHAAVVFIHGSGKQTRNLEWARRFARTGIAALVYDKRGAGESGGEYEGQQSVSGPNISLLADDAAAAMHALASHPALKGKPLGFAGISQAGWIAPLAAQRNPAADFLVLWSAPVCKVSEEDIFSKYTRDADDKRVPTYRDVLAARAEKYTWPDFLGRDTDASEDLDRIGIPGLWIFGDQDGSIPVDLSIERLQVLTKKGRRFDYVLVPGAGHNNMDTTFSVATDWIREFIR